MERRWYLGVAALLVVVIAVIIFLLLPVKDTQPVPADAPLAEKPAVGASLTTPTKPTLAAGAGSARGVTFESAGDPDPIGHGTSTVTGRVVLEGKPVTAYSVVVTRRLDVGMFANPREVRADSGAFAFEGVQAGTWNVLIGAPGIARKTVTGVKTVAGQITDLGDIEVNAGLRIVGAVVDAAARPIAGATVKLAGSGMSGFTVTAMDTGEVLSAPTAESESLRGRQSAITDARGRYQLDGVIPDVGDRRLWIEASHPKHGASPRTKLPDDDATIDFVLGGSGALDGRITVPLTQPVSVVARRINGLESPAQSRTDAQGQFRFDALYPGTYRLTVRSGSSLPVWHPREVTVVTGKRASVTLAESRVAVTVEIAVSRMCSAINLRATASDSIVDALATARCGTDKAAVFDDVEPGVYVACTLRSCMPIEVATTPAVQRFDGADLGN